MPEENFHASVQYNDWRGTAAADNHDNRSYSRYLRDNGQLSEGEMLIGVEVWSGEVHETTQDRPIYVTAIVASAGERGELEAALQSSQPLQVRRIHSEMHLNEFFGFFKRFEISISLGGLIDGRDITFRE